MVPALVCVARTQDQAQRILDRLREAGFSAKDTSVLLSTSKELLETESSDDTKKAAGAAAGLGIGAVTGGLTGLLLALTVFDVPEVGILIALGPIVVHIADAVAGIAGSAVGAIAGALVGIRLPDRSAKFYEKAVKEGNVLISVHVEDPARRAIAKHVFEANGGEDISDAK
jgi:uncharacterized membrane protein